MRQSRSAMVRAGAAAMVAACLAVSAPQVSAQLPLQPPRDTGLNVTPAFEGWYENPDGTFTLLVGYFNRNLKETFDIPVGPNNRIEPGGPDMGQPTHFLPRRQWGVFGIKVPKDFGQQKYTWTIVANGQTASIPLGLTKGYQVEPYKDAAMGNTPPALKLDPNAKPHQGPPETIATREAVVGKPLELVAWAEDDGHEEPGERSPNAPPALQVTWTKYRGPGEVKFSEAKPKINEGDGRTTTTATFSEPGEYMLRLQGNDSTGEGGGGFQCCWTNAYVKVNVKGGAAGEE